MGVVRTDDSRRPEIEEFRRMLVSCGVLLHRGKDEEEFKIRRRHNSTEDTDGHDSAPDQKLVCVTSGVSFLGIAVVKQLLLRGFAVRIIVDNHEDIERLREMEVSGEMSGRNNLIGVVLAKLNEPRSLMEAFEGCRGVFHTASFVDPNGLSGYSKSMAEIEVKATENVAEACAETPSVRTCILTSSLLACIWRDNSLSSLSPIVDHDCWSDETFCKDKKLWYALGKLRAEKVAWEIAKERRLKLVTICPGLITGPDFFRRCPTSTIAYLKGAREMYVSGLLATVDVSRLAEVHVRVFEEIKTTACGRYICFDQVVRSNEEVTKLAQEIEMNIQLVPGDETSRLPPTFELSNKKLSRLMCRTQRCT